MIYIDNNKLTIQNYKKVLKVSDLEIVFIFLKQTVFVKGDNLSISYFEKDEFQIQGKISTIEFYD